MFEIRHKKRRERSDSKSSKRSIDDSKHDQSKRPALSKTYETSKKSNFSSHDQKYNSLRSQSKERSDYKSSKRSNGFNHDQKYYSFRRQSKERSYYKSSQSTSCFKHDHQKYYSFRSDSKSPRKPREESKYSHRDFSSVRKINQRPDSKSPNSSKDVAKYIQRVVPLTSKAEEKPDSKRSTVDFEYDQRYNSSRNQSREWNYQMSTSHSKYNQRDYSSRGCSNDRSAHKLSQKFRKYSYRSKHVQRDPSSKEKEIKRDKFKYENINSSRHGDYSKETDSSKLNKRSLRHSFKQNKNDMREFPKDMYVLENHHKHSKDYYYRQRESSKHIYNNKNDNKKKMCPPKNYPHKANYKTKHYSNPRNYYPERTCVIDTTKNIESAISKCTDETKPKLTDVPHVPLLQIASYLQSNDLLTFSHLSSHFFNVCNSSSNLWKTAFKMDSLTSSAVIRAKAIEFAYRCSVSNHVQPDSEQEGELQEPLQEQNIEKITYLLTVRTRKNWLAGNVVRSVTLPSLQGIPCK